MRKAILTFIVAAMGTCMAHSEDYDRVSATYECSFLKPIKEFKSLFNNKCYRQVGLSVTFIIKQALKHALGAIAPLAFSTKYSRAMSRNCWAEKN